MAKVLIGSDLGSYSFDKTAKTITFDGFKPSLERVLMVTDTTNNTIIYQFNDPAKGGTLVGNVLTLVYNTTGGTFANNDALQIFYWSEDPQATAILDLAANIKRDLQMIRREPNMTTNGMGVNIIAGNVSTVSTVSSLGQLLYYGTSSEGAYSLYTHRLEMNNNWYAYKNKIIT